MKIAVTSQNRKHITEHAGACRKFRVYRVEEGVVTDRQLIELPIEQTLHASHQGLPTPLAGIDVLISAGMGAGLHRRLIQQGVEPVLTREQDPERAVAAFLANTLERLPSHDLHDCHEHHDHHEH